MITTLTASASVPEVVAGAEVEAGADADAGAGDDADAAADADAGAEAVGAADAEEESVVTEPDEAVAVVDCAEHPDNARAAIAAAPASARHRYGRPSVRAGVVIIG